MMNYIFFDVKSITSVGNDNKTYMKEMNELYCRKSYGLCSFPLAMYNMGAQNLPVLP